ncbi:hypothetical protein [Dyella mobilis]|uniref:Outer membrane porin, OprD family n=1 Tax=Dyella mobilis TaxID=1849582 RepID=A0ABS2KDJ0_9GAMM|nr:hypothetical protein [Dyella mobilis]MBM7129164.1 hypothetical protein [Dyella mobilis]GLQ98458.1 hypothetical protein GCM10007863_28780 [Dyella mobilis]
MRKNWIIALAATGLVATSAVAQADDSYGLDNIFTDGHVDGDLRLYNFNRWYDSKTTPNASAFSVAALVNAQTGTFFGGFSIGGSFVTSNSLGTHSDELAKIDTTLAGPNNSIGAFSQAYLQFKRDMFLFRGGYQYLADDPWMGNNDSRIIPSSYNALLVQVTPLTGWNLFAVREYSWKSRTSYGMYPDNLYYPSKFDGDSMYGNNGSLPLQARTAPGTWEGGTTYVNGGLSAQLRYYDFMNFARTFYTVDSYVFRTDTGFDPVIGAQYLSQNYGSDNRFSENDTKLFGIAGDRVKSQAIGGDLGVMIPNGRFDIYYNKLAREDGAVGGGALISPFTTNYGTDPLFTTSMIRGLVEAGPGRAWKGKFTYDLFDKKLELTAAYAKYLTDYRGHSHDLYFDVIYHLDGYLRGLTLRDRWELSNGGIDNLNPTNQTFVYNRVMIDYKF